MKLKNILIIAMAIVTLGLVVACSDDVVVASKDNNTNFAQVLESNGAFEYGGTKYETLQDAIEAIDKAKGYAPKTIKVLRDGVKTGAATVPSTITGSGIELNLNGNSLSFLSSTGVTVNGVFRVTGNGEITLDDKSADATAFAVGKGGALTVTDTTINVADQYAVKASGEGAAVDLFDGAIIAGNIAASDKAHIDLKSGSEVSGTLSTSGTGTSVQVFGKLEGNVNAANSSSIELSNSSSFNGNINVLSGASLSVGSAAAGTGPTIGAGSTITVSGANMTANKDAKNAELAMADGATVTVNDGGKIHITAFDNNTCTIICDDSKKAEIIEDADVNIDPENITDGFFKVAQDDGQIKYFSVLQDAVDSAVATTNNKKVTYVRDRLNTTGVSAYSTAEVLSDLTIDMNGNSDRVVITVSAGNLIVENTSSIASTLVGNLGNGGAGNITFDNVTVGLTTDTVDDAVNIVGAFVSKNSTFNATGTAGSVTDGTKTGTAVPYTYSNGSTFNGAITATGDITLYSSATAGDITSSTKVEAHNATLGNDGNDNIYAPVIVVDDSQIKANKVMQSYTATGPVETAANVISLTNLKGESSITRVLGAYSSATTYSNDYVVYITKASGTLTLGSTDNVAVEAQGNSAKAAIYIADVETDGETPVTTNKITINGAVTGTTAGEVKIVGKENHVVAANKKITSAGSVYVDYATNGTASLTESIAAGTSVTTKNSTFNGTVVAGTTVTDGTKTGTAAPYTYSNGSTFKSNVTASGNMYFYSSVFDSSSVNIETDGAGSIDMYNCSGTTGAIKSHKDVNSGTGYGAGAITIDNSTVATGKALNATGGVYSYGKLDSTEMTWNTVTLRGPNSVAYSSSATTNVVISGGITSNNLTAENIGVNNYSVIVHGQATIYGGVIDGRVTLGDGTSGSTKSSYVSVYTIASGTDAGSHKSIMKGGFFVGDHHTLTISDGEFGDSNSSTSDPIVFDTTYSFARIINGKFYVGTPSENDNASYLENVIESFYYDGSMSNEVNIYLTDNIVMDRQINTPAYKNVEFDGRAHSITNSSTATSYIRVDTGRFNLYNMTLTNYGTSSTNPIFAIYGGAYVYNITCNLVYDDAIKTMN